MLHYRSLDSGLSSPDDFDQDFDQSQETEQVLNSTAASNNETPLNQRYHDYLRVLYSSIYWFPFRQKMAIAHFPPKQYRKNIFTVLFSMTCFNIDI